MYPSNLRNTARSKIGRRCVSTLQDRLVIRENLSNRHATLIEATLCSHLPNIKWPSELSKGDPLPVGSFLAFFNHAVPEAGLGMDGYDNLQAPRWNSDCLVLRRWVGGKIAFHSDHMLRIGDDATCKEFARQTLTKISGIVNSRKRCAVTIDREISRDLFPDTAIVQESRTLLYHEATTSMLRRLSMAAVGKRAEFATCRPAFSHSVHLTETLLFRYSALCFNAHKIHINADYARQVESLSNTVVQGPLMVTLALRWLSSIMPPDTSISTLSYKNLGSAMAGETIQLLASHTSLDQWKIWITHTTDEENVERVVFEGSAVATGKCLERTQTFDGRR